MQTEATRWSALECVEHVAISEEFLLAKVRNAEMLQAPVPNCFRESRILKRGRVRSSLAFSSDALLPIGLQFHDGCGPNVLRNREHTIQFAQNCTDDLRSKLTDHPLLGPVTAYETPLLIVVHSDRHAEQIAELKSTWNERHIR